MDYYAETCHHKEISALKIVKYLLLCILILLLLGLTTLVSHMLLALSPGAQAWEDSTESKWVTMSCHTSQGHCFTYLLADYCAVFLITSIGLIATVKENFFFLLASALTNITLSIVNLFIDSFRWSIIFLQLCASLFTLAYTMSVYVKMKLDIRRKKRKEKLAILRSQLSGEGYAEGDRKSNLYQSSVHSHSYDKLVLTNEWLRTQHSPTAQLQQQPLYSQLNHQSNVH